MFIQVRMAALVVLLGLSVFFVACSGGGNGSANVMTSNSTALNAAPSFVSTPGTSATQGTTYTYQIATSPASVTLALVTAPSGATLNGNTLTWIPSAAQSRVANQFSLTATTAGGSTTQSWSVTPVGTITGSWVDTYWTANGPVAVPMDWSKAPIPPTAFISQPDGSFRPVGGSGNSDGTFTIPNVPAGYYWLQPAADAYWTSSSTFDFGTDFNIKPLKTVGSVATTTLNFNFSGLDPMTSSDALLFEQDVALALANVFFGPGPTGATSVTTSSFISSNYDFSQIDAGFMLQYEPLSAGGLNFMALGPAVEESNLVLNNGTTNAISGTLASSPKASFDLNIKGSAWPSLFSNIAPTTPTLLGSDLVAIAQPFFGAAKVGGIVAFDIPLVADAGELNQWPPTGCRISGSVPPPIPLPQPGLPSITTDQDFGIVQYEDGFPSSWPRILTFCEIASVPIPLAGSPTPIPFLLVDKQSTSIPTASISPLIGPVQNPAINNMNLFVASTVGATAKLSWNAPSGITPTGYKISTFIAGNLPDGTPNYIPSNAFYTSQTSASLLFLQPGKTYVFLITAILDGGANFESHPNRSALPTASMSVVSAPITISQSQ